MEGGAQRTRSTDVNRQSQGRSNFNLEGSVVSFSFLEVGGFSSHDPSTSFPSIYTNNNTNKKINKNKNKNSSSSSSAINGNNGSWTNSDDVDFVPPVLRRQITIEDDRTVVPQYYGDDDILEERLDELDHHINMFDNVMDRYNGEREALEYRLAEVARISDSIVQTRVVYRSTFYSVLVCSFIVGILLGVSIYFSVKIVVAMSDLNGNNGSYTNSDDQDSGSGGATRKKGGGHAQSHRSISRDSNRSHSCNKKKGGKQLNKPCRLFGMPGGCKYGDKCKFSHENLLESPEPDVEQPAQHEEPPRRVPLFVAPDMQVRRLYSLDIHPGEVFAGKRFLVYPWLDPVPWALSYRSYVEVECDMNVLGPLIVQLAPCNAVTDQMTSSATHVMVSTLSSTESPYYGEIDKQGLLRDIPDKENSLYVVPILAQQAVAIIKYKQSRSQTPWTKSKLPWGYLNSLALPLSILACLGYEMLMIPGKLTLLTMDYLNPLMGLQRVPLPQENFPFSRTVERLWAFVVLIAPFGVLFDIMDGLYVILLCHWVMLCIDFSMTRSILLGYILYSTFGVKILCSGVTVARLVLLFLMYCPWIIGLSLCIMKLIRYMQSNGFALEHMIGFWRRVEWGRLPMLMIRGVFALILRSMNLLRRMTRRIRNRVALRQIYRQGHQFELHGLLMV